MKKIVGLIVCLAFLGAIAAVFLINDMAFTTLISQDQTKIAGMLNRAEKKVNDAGSFEFEISKDYFKNGVTINREKVTFQANVEDGTLWANKETKDEDGKLVYTTEYYYDGTELYTKVITTGNADVFGIDTVSFEIAIGMVLDFDLVADEFETITGFFDRSAESLKDEIKVGDDVVGKKQTTSHITFSFSPFYLGERVVMEASGNCMDNFFGVAIPAEYEGMQIKKVSAEWALSLVGNVKQKVVKLGSEQEYVKRIYDYNQVGGVTVKSLSNKAKSEWGVNP